jgi:hypothetical protein
MRMAAIIVIFAVAALVVLSELGINITPLIAAVSIFGLALSFGSQTLVRDIVSGIFYLADPVRTARGGVSRGEGWARARPGLHDQAVPKQDPKREQQPNLLEAKPKHLRRPTQGRDA